ncbi:MAG: molybdopterin-binding protein [Betaproteobacteria bacterium]|nr:MAG: molybdopterin-binding protein [Betaproteobacteria bacterium]
MPEGVVNRKFELLRTPAIANLERRLFLKRGLSLGALSLLTGCNITEQESVQRVLMAMSRWNDGAQQWLFNPHRLAPEFPESRITRPFPFNAYYSEDEVVEVDGSSYKLELAGMIRERKPWTLAQLYALAQVSQVTRHICVEYVGFQCADDYYGSIDMATALHPQTIIALRYGDEILPPKYGYPMKLRIPTKLGFKNPKHITAMFVTNEYPGGYWEDKGYNWFSGS